MQTKFPGGAFLEYCIVCLATSVSFCSPLERADICVVAYWEFQVR